MFDLEGVEHFPIMEKIVDIITLKTQSHIPELYRVLVVYYFATLAGMMRTNVSSKDRGCVPINVYALNLATSGTGKGASMGIMENEIISKFRTNFTNYTLPTLIKDNILLLAQERAIIAGTSVEIESKIIEKEYNGMGPMCFSFDGGSAPAIKQLRSKLIIAGAGALNMEIDEIGSHLLEKGDALNTFLELYDVGMVKQKLTKNSKENSRDSEILGRIPANCLLFGTQARLLDGDKIEDSLFSWFDTGFARRLIVSYITEANLLDTETPEEIYNKLIDPKIKEYLEEISNYLGDLADISNFNVTRKLSKEVSIKLIEYKKYCTLEAKSLGNYDEIRKTELLHRYFKVFKISGLFAFIDDSHIVTMQHLMSAVLLVEESGRSFIKLLNRERHYVKLANYICDTKRELTQVDIAEDLPFYKGSETAKREMMNMAMSYSYKNNMIIQKNYDNGIEFFTGSKLLETDLDKIIISYSEHGAYDYTNDLISFNDNLPILVQTHPLHWISHHLVGDAGEGHRKKVNIIPSFNIIVIDVDGECQLATAQLLLKQYKWLAYTTKSHTDKVNRYRIIFPINFILSLDDTEFKDLMNNIYEWLPFTVDADTNQREKKWLSNPMTPDGELLFNEGELLDVLPFIPKTVKNEERIKKINTQSSMDNLERWFVNNTGNGNRSNQLIKFGFLLVDAGYSYEECQQKIFSFNNKIANKIEKEEIESTIFISVGKAINKRDE